MPYHLAMVPKYCRCRLTTLRKPILCDLGWNCDLHAVSCVHANPACPHPDIVRTPIDFVRTTGLSAFLWSGRRDSRTLCRLFRLHSPLLFSWSICSAFVAVHSVHANPACPHPDIVRTPIDFVRTTGLSAFLWSGRRDSDPRLSPWQGDTLPLSHSRISVAL